LVRLVGVQSFENCVFYNNTAFAKGNGDSHDWAGGGAIYNDKGSILVSNSSFEEQVALDHGGAIMNYMGVVEVRHTNFTACHANQGGALYTFM
jgi:hypothetical protein